MSTFEIKMPKLGESITEGTIVAWSVKVGDRVKEDDVLFEVTTAKVSAEVPSPVAGKVTEIRYQEGDTVPVGTTVALIELSDDETDETDSPAEATPAASPDESGTTQAAPAAGASEPATSPASASGKSGDYAGSGASGNQSQPLQPQPQPQQQQNRWYSPAVLQLAREAGISPEELDRLPGTGYEGRVSKKDIQDYIRQGKQPRETGASPKEGASSGTATTGGAAPAAPTSSPENASAKAGNAASSAPQPQTGSGLPSAADSRPKASAVTEGKLQQPGGGKNTDGDEVREMDRIRRIIADHMVQSKKVAPHVTTFVEADVTRLVRWRTRTKDEFLKQEGVALTYMPAITEAAARALKQFPQINASVDGYRMILKKHIHIGIAVTLPDGNLIVPVVHDADKLNLPGLAVRIDTLAAKARANKLSPDDLQGGTFTITNFGTFKNLFATPIINQPEAAILGVGYIEKKPAVVETPEGDAIAIRQKMFLSLSYDHRIIDGALGGAFLRQVADYLENWDR